MIHCKFCGSELPDNAQLCGNCGHKINDRYGTVTDISSPFETSISERQTPPFFSNPLNPNIQDSGMDWQATDSTFQTRWDVEDLEYANPQFTTRNTDENETILPDIVIPGMPAMQGQIPSPTQAPMVQGTPQFGGVPSVQGTPAAPGNVPYSVPGPPHGIASSAPSYAPQEAQSIPIHHQQVQQPAYQPPAHFYQPVHHQQHTPPPHAQEPLHHRRHHTGPLHEHRPHSSKLHHSATATSKAGMSVVSKWIIFTIAALVIIGSSSFLLMHALMPTPPLPVLKISGSNVVRDGGILHILGQGFQPGDGVTLTIDNGLPVSLASQQGTQAVLRGTERNAPVAGLSQLNIAGALQPHFADNSIITVSSTGTFDTNVTVPSGLPAGKHIIHATDNQSSRSASLQFTIPAPQLAVNPTSLNFGSVEVGRTVKLLVALSNQGGVNLLWTATIEGSNTNWLTLSKSTDVIGTNGSSAPIIVTANTNGLSVGPRTATLKFHYHNGDVQTTVKINVVSIGQSGQQAILNVSQQSLNFGQLQTGQQTQQSISIANLGNLPLQWQASSDAASTTWLSLATTKGTVQPGAAPQLMQVNVDTTGLAAGSYSGTIHVTSNGGNTQVGVKLVVTGSTVTPTPSPSPTTPTTLPPSPSPTTPTTTPSPTWTVSPTNLDVTNCSGTSTWTCVVTLKEDATSQVGITWTPSTDQSQVNFNPPGGTLVPGQSVKVTISLIPCSHANFTFSGSAGAQPVTALWNCSPTIVTTPLPTVTGITPTSGPNTGGTNVTITGTGFTGATSVAFGQATASKFTVMSDTQITAASPAGSGTVDVTVTTPGGTSAASSPDQFTYKTASPTVTGISPTIGPSTGGTNVTITGNSFTGATSVSFGQTAVSNYTILSDTQITAVSPAGSGTVDVTVTTPAGTSATSSADQFTYSTVSPTWSVNPTSLDASTCGLTAPCRITLTEDASSTGNITWSASSNIGATFKPQNGTLSPGAQNSLSIIAPCQSDTFTFTGSGGVKPLTVSWSCTPTPTPTPPVLTVNPSGITNCPQNSDGSWTCTLTLSLAKGSQGTLPWSSSSDLPGVTFSPSSGTLDSGQAGIQVSINIPSNDCKNGNMYFAGQNSNTIDVTWSCGS